MVLERTDLEPGRKGIEGSQLGLDGRRYDGPAGLRQEFQQTCFLKTYQRACVADNPPQASPSFMLKAHWMSWR